MLPEFLAHRRMEYGGGPIRSATMQEMLGGAVESVDVKQFVLRVEFESGEVESMLLPLARVPVDQVGQLLEPITVAGLVRISGTTPAVLCDALTVPAYGTERLRSIAARTRTPFGDGVLLSLALPAFAEVCGPDGQHLPPRPNVGERTNPSVLFGDRAVFKAFRRLAAGVNPDLEMSRLLTERQHVSWVAPLLGFVEYRRRDAEPTTLAVLHQYIPNQGDAWQLTLDQLSTYFERVSTIPAEAREQAPAATGRLFNPVSVTREEEDLAHLIGPYLLTARQIGERTADLHRALATEYANPAFTPEPFGRLYQRSIYQSMRNLTGRVLRLLSDGSEELAEPGRTLARKLLERESAILQLFGTVLHTEINGLRMRPHGDFHLPQLLHTGNDFVIVGFEGDITRPVGERRIKRSTLQDVGDMVHSFHCAVCATLHGMSSAHGQAPGVVRPEDRAMLEPWAKSWYGRVAQEYVASYAERMAGTGVLPDSTEARRILLRAFMMVRALRDTEAELNRRRDWIKIPLQAALRLVDEEI